MFLNYCCGILHFKGNFTKEAQHSRERYQERTNNAVTTVRNSMQNVSRSLWKCDPKKHVKGWCLGLFLGHERVMALQKHFFDR